MEIADRVQWLEWFQSTFKTEGWFNGQLGVLLAFHERSIAEPGSWGSHVDAAILHSIQNGMALVRGVRPRGDNPGARLWGGFFSELRSPDGPDERTLKYLWSQAEEAATHYGRARAELEGVNPTHGEWAVYGASEVYRGILAGSHPWYLDVGLFLTGFSDVDPRDAGFTYVHTGAIYDPNTPYGDFECPSCSR